MNIFGCGEQIFEPLEQLDQRFKLEDQYDYLARHGTVGYSEAKMKKSVGSVMQAL